MIEMKIDWTAENLKKYILFTSFFGNKFTKLSLIVFAVCFALILATCITMFAIIRLPVFLILTCAVIVFSAGYAVFFAAMIKRNVKRALASGGDNDPDSVILTDNNIVLLRGNEPFGELDWNKITRIGFNDRDGAAYLTAEGGAALILEYKNITAGSEQALREMLKEKNDKLPKEA